MIKAKRFWQKVSVARADEGGFEIWLDERQLRTPGKLALTVPSMALAEQIADEWRMVEGEIDPGAMPFTKRANTACERIPRERAAIESYLAEFIENELICYRATSPQELVDAQAAWDEWIEWAAKRRWNLSVTSGIMPVAQPIETIAAAKAWLGKWSDFELSAVHDYITILGSFVLGAALAEGDLDANQAFDLAHIDEDYQRSLWGDDDEAMQNLANKRSEIAASAAFQRHLA